MKKLLYVFILFALSSCTDEDGSRQLLESQGYKNIEITGYNPLSCSRDEYLATGFIATNLAGYKVEGTVCSGAFFKGKTIRF